MTVLTIAKLDSGHGPIAGAWTLTDPDGSPLMIGHHGCVAPTRTAAVDEARLRIDRGDGYTGYVG